MNILQSLTFNQMIIFVAGLLVLSYGILLIHSDRKIKEVQGTVISCERQETYDDGGDLIRYFYKTVIKLKKTGREKVKLDSGRQYYKGDTLRLEVQAGTYSFKRRTVSMLRKLVICLEGLILAAIPILQVKTSDRIANMALGSLLLVAGITFICMHQQEKRLMIEKVPMKIIKLLKVSNGKTGHRFVREQVSYYPILNGMVGGQSVDVIAPMSTGLKDGFQVGQAIDMEYCPEQDIFKKRIHTRGLLGMGIVLILLGSLGFVR